jgi:hypothetical protein
MQIKITDPINKETLVLDEFEAKLQGSFDSALGKDPSESRYRCSEDNQKMWPMYFNFTATGFIDTAKEGRLQVTAKAFYKVQKGEEPATKEGFHISLVRSAISEKMGGFVQHERIAKLIRENLPKLTGPAKACLLVQVAKAQKKEEECSSAHAARARVAKMIAGELKQKST